MANENLYKTKYKSTTTGWTDIEILSEATYKLINNQNGADIATTDGKMIYFANGVPVQSTRSLDGNKLINLINGELTNDNTLAIGATNKPIYINNGTIEPIAVGTTQGKMVYFNSGTITEDSTPKGNSDQPLYYDSEGGFKPINPTLDGKHLIRYTTTGFAYGNTQLGTQIKPVYVGIDGEVKPISFNSFNGNTPLLVTSTTDGGFGTYSANIGSNKQPLYYNGTGGFKTLAQAGSTTQPVYVNSSGEIQPCAMTGFVTGSFDSSTGILTLTIK